MKINTYSNLSTSVRLEPEEEWVEYSSDNSWPFFVTSIRWFGLDTITLGGPAQKVDGSRAFISREKRNHKFANLDPEIQRALIGSRRDAIQVLVTEEDLRDERA